MSGTGEQARRTALDDPHRLAAVRATGLLDAPRTEVLERLTRVATRLLGVPVAYVSLLDGERQWFAAATGLAGDASELRETTLSRSFCRHVVTSGEPLLVQDTTLHPLVRDNPAIHEFGVRAYAGVPLTTKSGETLGAFCVVDHVPHAWTDATLEGLHDLQAAALAELELRVSLASLRDHESALAASEARYQALIRSLPDGAVFLVDHELRFLIAGGQALGAAGMDQQTMRGRTLREVIPPASADILEPMYRAALAGEERRRLIASRGRFYDTLAAPVREPDGTISAGMVLSLDVTDRHAAEERLALALDATDDGVWDWDVASGRTHVSARYCRMLGWEPDEWSPHIGSWEAAVHPDDWPAVHAARDPHLRGAPGPYVCEYRMRHRTAGWTWILDRGKVVARDADGTPLRMIGTLTDVSARRAVDAVLQASEERANFLVALADATRALDDPAAIRVVAMEHLRDHFRADWVLYNEFDDDGQRMHFHSSASRPGHPEMPRTGTMHVSQIGDATLQALREGRVVAHGDISRLTDPQQMSPAMTVAMAEQGIRAVVRVPLMKGGRLVAGFGILLRTPREWTADDISLAREVAERCWDAIERARTHVALQEREAALRGSEERYALAARATGNAIWDMDVRANVVARSSGMLTAFGYAQSDVGVDAGWWSSRIHDDDRARVTATFAHAVTHGVSGMEWREEYRFRRADDTYAHVVDCGFVMVGVDGRPVRLIGAMQDVTLQHQLEARLRQSQKMEAIGQLAGGVAHDFNNLLTVIHGNLELVRSDLHGALPPSHDAHAELADVAHAAERARVLVRQLLAFSRKQPIRPQHVRLGDVVRSTESLLRRVIGEEIVLDVVLDDSDAVVNADPGQLEQVLMNLAVNARDAMLMPMHGRTATGGTLQLRTGLRALTLHESTDWTGLTAGDYVFLRVQDNGHGMDADTLARAFEPFFTTKDVGHGTGLGLATAYGIVQQAGGAIRVESVIGEGTTFTVLFPRVVDVETVPPAPSGARVPARARSTILLVEDEAAVRATARRMLERAGYTVFEAVHGADALDVWRQHGTRIDGVVTDIRMPQLGGRELVAQLRVAHPALPVVFMSGYSEQEPATSGRASGAFVEKPFATDTLLSAVARELERVGVR